MVGFVAKGLVGRKAGSGEGAGWCVFCANIDFRIYACIAGCDPMRIFIYNEGLVRFSTEKY